MEFAHNGNLNGNSRTHGGPESELLHADRESSCRRDPLTSLIATLTRYSRWRRHHSANHIITATTVRLSSHWSLVALFLSSLATNVPWVMNVLNVKT